MMKIKIQNLKIWAPGEGVKECRDILGSAMEQTQNRVGIGLETLRI